MNRFAIIRASYGILLLVIPDQLVKLTTGLRADRTTRNIERLLGVRHLAQGLATLDTPSPMVLALGAEADLAHSLSMLGLVGADPSRRRTALADAAIAASFALTSTILTWRATRRRPLVAGAGSRLSARRDTAAAMVARWTLPAGLRQHLTPGRP